MSTHIPPPDGKIATRFIFDISGYEREIHMTQVPAIGERLTVDDHTGRVMGVHWPITSGYPCGRSAMVSVEEWVPRA